MIPQPADPECHDPHCTNPRHCGRCGAHHVVARMHEKRERGLHPKAVATEGA